MINILDLLNVEEKRTLTRVSVTEGSTLFIEGQECQEVGIVESGELQIISYTHDGGEILYRTVTKGMMFGNNLVFSSDTSYKGNVIATNDSVINYLKKADLVQILQQNTAFLLEFLKYQSDMGKELNSQIKLLNISSAEERLYYFAHLNDDQIRYKSITSLAALLSIQRETLSRLISRLIKESKIIRKNKTIKIIH